MDPLKLNQKKDQHPQLTRRDAFYIMIAFLY